MASILYPYPDIKMPSSAAIAYSATGTLNGTSDYQGFVASAEESITITSVGILFGTRTGSPGNPSSTVTFANGSTTITGTFTGSATLTVGDRVRFTTTGTLPTPLVVGTYYYVVSQTSSTCTVSATSGGSAITMNTTSSSGVHTLNLSRGLRIGIAYVDATTGFPATTPVWADGTFSGAAGTAYQDFNATTDITVSVFNEAVLTTPVTITKGSIFAILVDPTVGTWDTSNLLNTVRGINNAFPYLRFPYGFENTAGTFAFVNTASPIFYYKSSTTTYGHPLQTFVGVNNNSGSTPDEYGLYFRIPTGTCTTYKVEGMRLGFTPGSADFDVLLYDTDGATVLHSMTVDGNIMHTGNGAAFDFLFPQTTLATLTAGSYYRLVVRPSTTTAMGSVQYMTFPASADKKAVLGNADDVQYTSRTNAGSWTEVTDRLWTIQALISDMTATGGGGLAANPMAGYVL